MKRWLDVLWLFIGLICLLGGVTWSVIAQTPAYPFNPPTFAGSNAPGNCANGSLFFNITSYLWQSCGPNNTWANLNGFPNSYLPPQAPVVGSSDTLSCSATTGITSAPVAFATTITLPAFTQVAGASYEIRIAMNSTTSASPPNFTISANLGATAIYSSLTVTLTSLSSSPSLGIMDIMASVIGSSGAINTSVVGAFGPVNPNNSRNITTNPVTSFDTTIPNVLTLFAQCSTNTAGNTMTLKSISIQRIY